MQYFVIGIVGTFIWMAFEMWRAPHMDEQTGRITKPSKKFKDFFKRN